jgi:hypothetical protein
MLIGFNFPLAAAGSSTTAALLDFSMKRGVRNGSTNRVHRRILQAVRILTWRPTTPGVKWRNT